MKIKRISYGALVLSLLSCNYVSQMIASPTATPPPTFTLTINTPTLEPLVPAYIPPQCDPAMPIATISPAESEQLPPVYEPKPISRRMQLRVVDDIESIVKEVYVYPDFNGHDWSSIVARYREKVDEGLETADFYHEMQKMISELGDDHSSFLSPVEVEASNEELKGENDFVGVGIYSTVDFERGRLIIISTFPDSPAEYSGLQSHDSVLSVDGLPITIDGGIRTRGPECSAVVLTVQTPGEVPRDVILIRSSIDGSIPIDARLVPTIDGSRIGYIFIPSFFDETLPPQIEGALQDFGQLDGLILDVRMNGGGSSTVAYPILSFFVDGRLGDFVSRTERRALSIEGNPINNSQTVPLVVMVNDETISFGELFAGILRDVHGAKITGQTSLGNVEVLHGYPLDDGSYIWLATETFDSAYSDDNWEEIGIVPDLQAYAEWDTFYFDTDPSIAAALDLLGHK